MIRYFKKDDLKICAEIFYNLFSKNEWQFDWLTFEKAKLYFTDLFNTPNFIGYVILEDEKIIGACLGIGNKHFVNNQYEIKEIFISNEFRKNGYGTKILNFVENDLIKNDFHIITLYTQRNIFAHDFYLKKNYNLIEETIHMLKIL